MDQPGPSEVDAWEPQPQATQPLSAAHEDADAEPSEDTPLLSESRDDSHSVSVGGRSSFRAKRRGKGVGPPVRPDRLPLQLFFALVSLLLYVATCIFVMCSSSTLHPSMSSLMPAHHGSTFVPMWYSFLAIVTLVLVVAAFAMPASTPYGSRALSLMIVIFSLVDIVALLANPELRTKESSLTIIVAFVLLLSNVVAAMAYAMLGIYFVKFDKALEAERDEDERRRFDQVVSMADDQRSAVRPHYSAIPILINRPISPPSTIQEEQPPWTTRVKNALIMTVTFTTTTLPLFLIHLAVVAAMFLITADLVLRAYDSSYTPPAPGKYWRVSPGDGAGTYRLLLACGPFNETLRDDFRLGGHVVDGNKGKKENSTILPRRTIVMFSPAGVAGLPASQWALNLSSTTSSVISKPSTNEVDASQQNWQRICYYDRPGYGFSDNAPTARLNHTARALQQALEVSGEVARITRDATLSDHRNGFVLVGQGFGGMVARVFASNRPNLIAGAIFIDSQTEFTYFNPLERTIVKQLRYVFSDYLSALFSPLGFRRYFSLIFGSRNQPGVGRSRGRLARLLSSARDGLNPSMARASLQEAHLAQSHTSHSYFDLINSNKAWPINQTKVIVISSINKRRLGKSKQHLNETSKEQEEERWRTGQEFLANVIGGNQTLVRWDKVERDGNSKYLCNGKGQGRRACEQAILDLMTM